MNATGMTEKMASAGSGQPGMKGQGTSGDMLTRKMAEAGDGKPELRGQAQKPPQKGEHFRCAVCGMEIGVTRGCSCPQDHTIFHCCGQPMTHV